MYIHIYIYIHTYIYIYVYIPFRGSVEVGGRAEPLNPAASAKTRRNRAKENQKKRKIYGVSKSTFCENCDNTKFIVDSGPKVV